MYSLSLSIYLSIYICTHTGTCRETYSMSPGTHVGAGQGQGLKPGSVQRESGICHRDCTEVQPSEAREELDRILQERQDWVEGLHPVE